MARDYANLAPELRALSGDARRIWGDAEERRLAFETMVAAWERGDAPTLRAAVARVDDAIVGGLRALGLPRGPVTDVQVELIGRGWLGRKLADCRLLFDGEVLRRGVRELKNPDEVTRTWVHESIHARRMYATRAAAELRQTPGYEEGLAEGLARLVTREAAGLSILESSYTGYVRAYEALAATIGGEAEAIWRALWPTPTGEVRDMFTEVVDRWRRHQTGAGLTDEQRRRLQAIADRMFVPERARDQADLGTLVATWGVVFR